MANTLNNVNVAQIADRSLEYLGLNFFPLKALSTDFSEDIKSEGESVSTRIPAAITAKDLSAGYSADDVSNTGVTVTLNRFRGPVFAFTDLEASKAGDVNWLKDNFIEPAMEGLMNDIFQYIYGLVTAASFPNSTVITAVNMDADELADLGTELSTLKVPKSNRSAILPPGHVGGLIKDSIIEDASAFGDTNAIKEGTIMKARGFQIHEFASIPNNSENLLGFVCHKSAFAFAARAVADPTNIDGNAPLGVENRVDPVTGLPIQFRAWYEPKDGKYYFSMGTLYGATKAQANALHRIKSA